MTDIQLVGVALGLMMWWHIRTFIVLHYQSRDIRLLRAELAALRDGSPARRSHADAARDDVSRREFFGVQAGG